MSIAGLIYKLQLLNQDSGDSCVSAKGWAGIGGGRAELCLYIKGL